MTSVKQFLGRYKPAEKTVRILMDGSLAAELEEAKRRVDQTRRAEERTHPGLATQVPSRQAEVDRLEAEAEEATAVLTLRAMSGAKFDELKQAHPPTEQQWAAYREEAKALPLFTQAPEVDPMGMAPAVIAYSVVAVDGEPVEWDETDGAELWDSLPDGARADLLEAAWQVNRQGSSRPFSETGTATTPSSGPELITQQTEESPSLSSAEGS